MSRPALPSTVARRLCRGTRLAAAAAILSAAASQGFAQALPPPLRDVEIFEQAGPPAAERTGRARFFDPDDGLFDLSYFLEDPRGFLPVPAIVTEPAVGFGGGGIGLFLRPRREAGAEGWARPDISALGAIATQNGTWVAFGADASRWLDGRLRTLAFAGAGTANLDFYGLGAERPSSDGAVRYSLQISGAGGQVNWQLAPLSPWAVGLRYVYADVDPRLRDTPVAPGLADRVRVTVSAPTAVVEYDTRNNVFTPTRGVYAESAYLASRVGLGATVDFERFDQTAIGWLPASDTVTLGARATYVWSSDGTPFFMRPFVQLRGVPAVRYQGDQAASFEAEARWQLHGRFSVVLFGGAGGTWTRRGERSFTDDVASGGVGMRYELARKFGLHVGIDVAHSPGTTAVYLVVGNAWFRP